MHQTSLLVQETRQEHAAGGWGEEGPQQRGSDGWGTTSLISFLFFAVTLA